jgi:hypothetical protein
MIGLNELEQRKCSSSDSLSGYKYSKQENHSSRWIMSSLLNFLSNKLLSLRNPLYYAPSLIRHLTNRWVGNSEDCLDSCWCVCMSGVKLSDELSFPKIIGMDNSCLVEIRAFISYLDHLSFQLDLLRMSF